MSRKSGAQLLRVLVTISFVVSACGTQDYDDSPDANPSAQSESPQKPGSTQQPAVRLLSTKESSVGYAWYGLHWIGVSDARVSDVKCRLADGTGVNDFQAFGASVLGGAILGLIIRVSGSWFFGGPVHSEAGHWFWNKLDKGIKASSQGFVRGALFGGMCQMLLAGGTLLPFPGMLGQSFEGLSTALALGGMTTIAATPFIENMFGKEQANRLKLVARDPATGRFVKSAATRSSATVLSWSNAAGIVKGALYRMSPRIIIWGLGAGVGVVVYKELSSGEQCASAWCLDECQRR